LIADSDRQGAVVDLASDDQFFGLRQAAPIAIQVETKGDFIVAIFSWKRGAEGARHQLAEDAAGVAATDDQEGG
jgi:hypothetical protein